MAKERDYVLGTHDAEVERLGLQHRIWRAKALDAWRRAGFTVGQTLLDVGSGPGFASIDLAGMAGSEGRVVAVDRSHHFLETLRERSAQQNVRNIQTFELDLDHDPLPPLQADGAWARWVFSFVREPRALLQKIHAALKPGGRLVLHEYMDYQTWKIAPRSEIFEEFVLTVMKSWRASGGEPDIAPSLAVWLRELGFEIRSTMPHIEVVGPSNFFWQWPRAFIETGTARLVEIGYLTVEKAAAVREAFESAEANPDALVVTPAVLEIIAMKK